MEKRYPMISITLSPSSVSDTKKVTASESFNKTSEDVPQQIVGGSQQHHPRFEPSDITQEMLDGAKDVIVKKREMKEEEVQAAASRCKPMVICGMTFEASNSWNDIYGLEKFLGVLRTSFTK